MPKKGFVGRSVREELDEQLMSRRPFEHASFNDTLEFMLETAYNDGTEVLNPALERERARRQRR